MRPSALADGLIGLLRFPVLLAAVLLVWPVGVAVVRVAGRAGADPWPAVVFLLAAAGCVLVGVRLGRHRVGFGHFGTLEHEIGHAVIALATFHPLKGASVRRDSGHVSYASVSGGNWLIGIAPYLLPLVPLAAIVAMSVLTLDATLIAAAGVGAATGWHVLATMYETKPSQPDLVELGRFTWVPLVAVGNPLVLLLLFAWASGGDAGVAAAWSDLVEVSTAIAAQGWERLPEGWTAGDLPGIPS